MGVLRIKGVTLGEGRPKTIVSLMGKRKEELLSMARRAVDAGADMLELRADFAQDVHDHGAVAAFASAIASELSHTPLVFTFRSVGQGGHVELSTSAYAKLLRTVVTSGAIDVVDVEATRGDDVAAKLVRIALEAGVHTIVSYHDFKKTPDTAWMVSELTHMVDLGASIPKLAVMAHDVTDCLRLMEATAQATSVLDVPIITMAMGASGVLSRLTGEAFGSAATFCSLDAASAPGQVELTLARTTLDGLHVALTTKA